MRAVSIDAAEGDRLVAALERCRPRLRRILASFRLPKEDAEDLLQELALQAVRRDEEIESLDGWLPVVARYLCIQFLRKKHRWVGLPEDYEPSGQADQERVELWIDLEKALAILRRGPRNVIVLQALGCKSSEIVYLTGYSPRSIVSVAARARGRLLEYLAIGEAKQEVSS